MNNTLQAVLTAVCDNSENSLNRLGWNCGRWCSKWLTKFWSTVNVWLSEDNDETNVYPSSSSVELLYVCPMQAKASSPNHVPYVKQTPQELQQKPKSQHFLIFIWELWHIILQIRERVRKTQTDRDKPTKRNRQTKTNRQSFNKTQTKR